MTDKSKRIKAREYAFQMMYRFCMTEEAPIEIPESFWSAYGSVDPRVKEFAEFLFKGAASKQSDNDALIEKFLRNGWTLERMGEVEKNMMRVALFELLDGESPYFAVLDDFVTLTKKFSDDSSAGLVNAILDNVRKSYNLSAGKND